MAHKQLTLKEQVKIARSAKRFKAPAHKRGDKIDRTAIARMLLPNHDLYGKGEEFVASDKPDKILVGAYGSGKTTDGAAEAITLSYINHGFPGLVVIQTMGNSKRTTRVALIEMCDKNNLSWSSTKPDISYEEFKINFGDGKEGIMWLMSGWTASNIVGPNVAWAWIDEPFIQDEATYIAVLTRIRITEAPINELFMTGTIEPDMTWGEDFVDNSFYGNERTLKVVKTLFDNKYADPEFVKRVMARFTEEQKQMYVYAVNVDFNGKNAYSSFKSDKNVKPYKEFELPKAGTITIGLGFDFNVGAMAASEFLATSKTCDQIDEYKIADSNTEELCELIKNRWEKKYPGIFGENAYMYSIIITADTNAKSRSTSAKIGITDAKEIHKAFCNGAVNATMIIPEVNPPVRDRVTVANKMFELEQCSIYDNCEDTIKDRKLVKWKKGEDKFRLDKSNVKRTHSSDAADYFMWLWKHQICGRDENADEDFTVYEREER